MKINYQAVILIYWFFLVMAGKTFREYYLNSSPPVWDSLSYQYEAVSLARYLIEGDFVQLKNLILSNVPIGYIFFTALSYIVFGFNTFSPFMISALFGGIFLIVLNKFLLSENIREDLAFVFTLLFVSSMSFLENNLFETRNDSILGVCFLFFAYSLKEYFKTNDRKYLYYSVCSASISTFFKLSSPGYIVWIFVIFLVYPDKSNSFMKRLKVLSSVGIAFFIFSGWMYFINYSNIIEYYSQWKEFSFYQYGLQETQAKNFFYLRNIFTSHFPVLFFSIAAVFLPILFLNEFLSKRLPSFFLQLKASLLSRNLFFYFLPVLFLTVNRSFSSAGDTPVIAFLFLFSVQIISVFISSYHSKTVLSIGMLLSFLLVINSLTRIKFVNYDKLNSSKLFFSELNKFKAKNSLEDAPLLTVFSHPVLNPFSYSWYNDLNQINSKEINFVNRIQPKDWAKLSTLSEFDKSVQIIQKYPILVLPSKNPVEFGGEYFVQLNRMNKEIQASIKENNLYDCSAGFMLAEVSFTICLKKDFAFYKVDELTADGWITWKSGINFYSLNSSEFLLSVKPMEEIKSFNLKSSEDNQRVSAKLIKVDEKGFYHYTFILPKVKKPTRFTLENTSMSSQKLNQDPRPLAFYNYKLVKIR